MIANMEDIGDELPASKTALDSQDIAQETPPDDVFFAPSIDKARLLAGESYTYHSSIPKTISEDMTTECVLGVDEAGRGPVLGMSGPKTNPKVEKQKN